MTYEIDNSNDPALACAGKEYFDSMGKATRAASNIKRKLGKGRTQMQAYACQHCGGYHIGSHAPARLSRIKKIGDPSIRVSFSRGVK